MKLPDKFAELEDLDPGKNAKVFKAVNALLNRPIFLKVYPFPENDALSALREPQILQGLEHDHLVKIYSADTIGAESNRHICLEMELMNGGSLKRLLDASETEGKWVSVHESISLAADTAAGLGHLHDRGFVHRDIKPANVMIRESNSGRRAVVTDLGLASRLNATSGRAFASKHARLYRPPEVWQALGYSVRSDVYQLGIVLYQLLGGRLNFNFIDLSDTELAQKITKGLIFDWDRLPPHISPPLRTLLKRATNADEANRFESMADFCVALNNVRSKQYDWRYESTLSSFSLERQEQHKLLRLEVRQIDTNTFAVQRHKRSTAGFRRVGPEVTVKHANLSHCQEFQKIIREPW